VDWTAPSALILGGEAEGAGEEAAQVATGRVRVPMAGGAESLNAAMAATVILFEAARQRRG
jgi:RNA methyltransferase, TrmH family